LNLSSEVTEAMATTVELENERVRVLRVKHAGRERHPRATRGDRLIIYLNDGHITRTENGRQDRFRHKAGDVVWRGSSQHQIENMIDSHHEVLIVELKQ
jgi:hypothetical protein